MYVYGFRVCMRACMYGWMDALKVSQRPVHEMCTCEHTCWQVQHTDLCHEEESWIPGRKASLTYVANGQGNGKYVSKSHTHVPVALACGYQMNGYAEQISGYNTRRGAL